MAGHSHSANIAVRKGKQDAQRGQAVQQAEPVHHHRRAKRRRRSRTRTSSFATPSTRPAPSACRATISSGPSSAARANWAASMMEELTYEGFGPGGVAVFVDVADRQPQPHQRRSPQDLRERRRQHGRPRLRRLLFDRKGVFAVDAQRLAEDALMNVVLEAGADDMSRQGDVFEIICDPSVFAQVQEALAKARLDAEIGRGVMLPKSDRRCRSRNRQEDRQAHGNARRPRRRAERLYQCKFDGRDVGVDESKRRSAAKIHPHENAKNQLEIDGKC